MSTALVDIRLESAPALGDIRALSPGSHIYVFESARRRPDWGRYQDAIRQAVARGVNVSWLERRPR